MDLTTLERNHKLIENISDVLEKNYKTFYLLDPKGVIESVAGLEYLLIPFLNISYKTIICYKCLSFFDCECNSNFRRCPNCKVVNAILSNDNIGKKVLILICFHCKSRNITNIDTLYVQCYLCNYINYIKYFSLNYNNAEEISNNRVVKKRRFNFFKVRNMCICMKNTVNNRNNSIIDSNTNFEHNNNTLNDQINENNMEHININNPLDVDIEIGNNEIMNTNIFNNEETHGIMFDSRIFSEDNSKKLNNLNINNTIKNPLFTNERVIDKNIKNSTNNNIKNDKINQTKRNSINEYQEVPKINKYEEGIILKNNSSILNDNKIDKYICNLSTETGSCPRDSSLCYNENLNIPDNKLKLVVTGNVKRKTLIFSNKNFLSNKKIVKNLSFVNSDKRYSDVKRCIEYFNKLRDSSNSNIKILIENGKYREAYNLHNDNDMSSEFYLKYLEYLEFYERCNLKNTDDECRRKNDVYCTRNGNFNYNQNKNHKKSVKSLSNFELDNNNTKNRNINHYNLNQKKSLNNSQKLKTKNGNPKKKINEHEENELNKKNVCLNENNKTKSKNKNNFSNEKKKKKKKHKSEIKNTFYSQSELWNEFRSIIRKI